MERKSSLFITEEISVPYVPARGRLEFPIRSRVNMLYN